MPTHIVKQWVSQASIEIAPYRRSRPIFIQYLNPEILTAYGRKREGSQQQLSTAEMLQATRLALIATDSYLVMPASYLFEVPGMSRLLAEVSELIDLGFIGYCSPSRDLSSYREQKLIEYRRDRHNPYTVAPIPEGETNALRWQPRQPASTAHDIELEWVTAFSEGGRLHTLLPHISNRIDSGLLSVEATLVEVPAKLEQQAFITRLVEQILPFDFDPMEQTQVDFFLSAAYLKSYLTDLNAAVLVDFPFGYLSCGLERDENFEDRMLSAHSLDLVLRWLDVYHYVHFRASWAELVQLRESPEFSAVAEYAQRASGLTEIRRVVLRNVRLGAIERAESLRDTLHTLSAVAPLLEAREA